MRGQQTFEREASIAIGPWAFDPSAQTLRRDDEVVRLEHRAAGLLELFVARSGEVISREEIVDAIWNGRVLSDNSVAVVVSDLRRALGDDARAPSFIETIPKCGYRMPSALVRKYASVPGRARMRRFLPTRLALASLAAFLVLLVSVASVGLWPFQKDATPRTIITINDVRNQTGSQRYNPLARAITEIGTAYLSSETESVLVRDRWDFDAADPSRGLFEDFGSDARVYHVSSTIVMDGKTPRLIMVVNDPRTNEVLWSHQSELSDVTVGEVVRKGLSRFLHEARLQ